MSVLFEEVVQGIYRLKIPFYTVYTSVFLVVTESGAALVDCATTDRDVDEYIITALHKLGYRIDGIKLVVVTHNHADHAGGISRILHHAPKMEVISSARPLFDGLETYPLHGHTNEMIGLFDARTGTLISGDGLQGAGVDKYRCSVEDPRAYLQTLDRIRADIRIEGLVFSHAYEPWLRDAIFGRAAVLDCLNTCEKNIGECHESNTCQ